MAIFNRPETTERVFAAVAAAKPPRLFVFADGPRSGADVERCERSRALVQRVDWDCDVQYNFAEENLGARRRFATGLNWAFGQASEMIVLEDDTLPDATYFPFCDAILERYRDDPRVMMITGSNYVERWHDDRQSYHFSIYGSVWGWASWKRAWDLYDGAMTAWGDDDAKSAVRDLIGDEDTYQMQATRFDRLYDDPADRHCWDPPWVLSRLIRSGLTVVPARNLITNLGNTGDHGLPPEHPLAQLPTVPMRFPLTEPDEVAADREYDREHVHRILDYWDEQERLRAATQTRARSIPDRVARVLRRTPGVLRRSA
jgi:hypothetical protein